MLRRRLYRWILKLLGLHEPFNPSRIQLIGERVTVPTFEIATNPSVRLSEIRARRFHIVDQNRIDNGSIGVDSNSDASIMNRWQADSEL